MACVGKNAVMVLDFSFDSTEELFICPYVFSEFSNAREKMVGKRGLEITGMNGKSISSSIKLLLGGYDFPN